MRGARVGAVLCLAVLLGCGGGERERPPPRAPTPAPPLVDVRFLVNLPAVVLWGAEERARQPDASEELRRYHRLEERWTTQEYLDCRWGAEDLDEFWACAEAHIPAEHRRLVESVLNDVVKDVRPTWNDTRASLRWLAVMLSDFLEREDARQVLAEVQAFAGPEVFVDPIRVPLVPHGLAGEGRRPHFWGSASGDRAVLVEIPRLRATQYFATFVHELVHVANGRASGREELLAGLEGRGTTGLIALTRWDEATAEAFELRGGRRFNLAAYDGVPYPDASVRALAERLVARMDAGPLPPLGRELAPLLLAETERARPPESWVVTDFAWQLVVFSEIGEAMWALGDSAQLLRDVHWAHLAAFAEELPPQHSVLVLATADELAAHPSLTETFGGAPLDAAPPPGEVKAQITRRPDGTLALLITGAGEAEVTAGAAYLAAHHHDMALPPPGWHTMIAGPAPGP